MSDSSLPPDVGSGLLCPIPLADTVHPPLLLVVDDEDAHRDVLSRRLEQRGYATRQASSGPEALDLLDRHQFDVVLLDVQMPVMSGYEVLQRIRMKWPAGVLPVMMVSARDRSEDVVEALALGANDYVVKPIDLAVTLARIDTQVQRRRGEARMRENEQRYVAALAGANDGIWHWALATNQLFCSESWRLRFGCRSGDAQSTIEEWFSRIHEDDRARVRGEIDAHVAGLSSRLLVEFRMRDASDTYRWVLARGLAVRDANGLATRLAGSFTDITEGKEGDALTSLSTRVLFMDRLAHFIERSPRTSRVSSAVLLMELHGLKAVNDAHGRPARDQLLVAVTQRLEHRVLMARSAGGGVRQADAGHTLARLDGDEFAILLHGIRDVHDSTRVAESIHDALTQPIVLDGREVYVTASIGIVAAVEGYTVPDEVVRDAGVALSRAKAQGRSRHEVFEPDMRDRILGRQRVEDALRPALERGEFRLHYQPIVRLDRETLAGFEALLRWEHPERGLLQPEEFVPLAEEADLIVGVGRWVVREACQQLREWRDEGFGSGRLSISINLSSQEFQQPDLVDYVGGTLGEYGLEGRQLEIEITESTAMAHPDLVVARLEQLRALGVSVSLDDFGSGHSSLAYLHRLPVNRVKIDRSFVARLFATGDRDSRPIVRAVLAMARDMGIEVVAEGVEEVGQFDLLCGLSCQLGQGYLFSKPVSAASASDILRQGLRDGVWQVGQRSLLPGPDGSGSDTAGPQG